MNQMTIRRAAFIAAVLLFMPATFSSARPDNQGIARLIYVMAQKANNANEEALQGAAKQRALVRQQKDARQRARETEVLRQLEENAGRWADVVDRLKAAEKYLRDNPCK